MSEFRFAIMGAGMIARKFCHAVKLLEGCTVVAVASKNRERAEAFAQKAEIPAFYECYEQMLKEQKPDCVYIATTPDSHAELSLLCLQYDVPVLCEKAMFRNSAEAKAVFDLSKQKNIFVMEALWARFLPPVQKARQWIKENLIGSPIMSEMSVGFGAPRDPENRYFNPALGGGAANDVTVYGHQVTTWVLDRRMLRASVEVVPGYGVDVTEAVLMQLEGNFPALIKSTLLGFIDERLVIYGEKGRIVIPYAHMCKEAFLYDASGELVEHFVDQETVNGFTYEVAETVRCIREGRCESDVVPHWSTMDCCKLFDQIAEKMKENQG